MNANDYPYIRAWGRLVGSNSDYINRQVIQARDEGAPPNAVYRDVNGHWQTTDDVILPSSRSALGLGPLPLRPVRVEDFTQQLWNTIRAWGPLRYYYGLDAIEPLPDNTGLRLTFSTGYSAELRVSIRRPDRADSEA